MKTLNLILTFMLLSCVTIFQPSCKRGSCDGVNCLNGGDCKSGKCHCPKGFEGEHCETKITDKFVGNYAASDRCDYMGIVPDYDVEVQASGMYPEKIIIKGFAHLLCNNQSISVEATVNGSTNITIPKQVLCSMSFSISGTGYYSSANRSLNIDYFFENYNTGIRDTCSAVYLKK